MKSYASWMLLLLLSISVLSFAQQPNYSGKWILDMEKSILQSKPDGLTGSIFLIQQSGQTLKLVRYHIAGEKLRKIGFKMHADGRTRRIKILFKGKLEWQENKLKASLWRKNFSNIVTYSFGADQNEFIADEVFHGLPKDHHNIWVFRRVSEK